MKEIYKAFFLICYIREPDKLIMCGIYKQHFLAAKGVILRYFSKPKRGLFILLPSD